jgi:hypothetical protein
MRYPNKKQNDSSPNASKPKTKWVPPESSTKCIWIDVRDSRPEMDVEVLVYTSMKRITCGYLHQVPEDSTRENLRGLIVWILDPYGPAKINRVSHWAEMPLSPEIFTMKKPEAQE